MTCRRCESVPDLLEGPATLHLWAPLGHSAGKLTSIAAKSGVGAAETGPGGGVSVDVAAGGMAAALDAFEAGLSRIERAATRVVMKPQGAPLALADFAEVLTLSQHAARWRNRWLIARIAAEALEVGFSPIAHADAPGEIHAHEARVRAIDPEGRAVSAPCLFDLADSADLLFVLDRQARISSIRAARAAALDTPVFIGFSPSAIYDPKYCLRTTVAEAERQGLPREDIVFTILPAEAGGDVDHLDGVLRYYRDNGFRTAMCLSAERTISFDMLQRLRPDVLFLDATMTDGLARDAFKEVVARKMLEIAQRLQIETVVSGVVDAQDCEWAYAHGASYVQGPHVAALAVPAAA